MNKLFWIILVLIGVFACSESTEIPESYASISESTKEALDLLGVDNEKAMLLCRENLAEAKKNNYHHLTAKNYTYIGWIFEQENQAKKAYVAFNDALKFWEKADSVSIDNMFVCYNSLGVICKNHKEYDQAILYYHKAIEKAGKLGNARRASAHYNYAVALKYKEDSASFFKAEEQFLEALRLAEKSKEHELVASVYYQIGRMYKGMNDYDIAYMSFKNCLKYANLNDLDEYKEVAYQGLGQIEKLKGNHDRALEHFEKALTINYDKDVIFEVKKELGESYLSKGNTDKAITSWESALAQEYNPNDPDVLDVYKNLSLAYQLNNQLDKALAYSEHYSNNLQSMLESTEYIQGGYDKILFKEVISQYDEFQNQQTWQEQIRVTYIPAGLALISLLIIISLIIYYFRRARKRVTAEKIKSFQVD